MNGTARRLGSPFWMAAAVSAAVHAVLLGPDRLFHRAATVPRGAEAIVVSIAAPAPPATRVAPPAPRPPPPPPVVPTPPPPPPRPPPPPPPPEPEPQPAMKPPEPTPPVAPEPPAETAMIEPDPAPAPAEPAAPPAGAPEPDEAPVGRPDGDPRILGVCRPSYPRLSRLRGEEGTVLLSIRVSAGGAPEAVEVVSSSGAARLDQAAADAVRRTTFVPARRAGRPVASSCRLSVVFRLEDPLP